MDISSLPVRGDDLAAPPRDLAESEYLALVDLDIEDCSRQAQVAGQDLNMVLLEASADVFGGEDVAYIHSGANPRITRLPEPISTVALLTAYPSRAHYDRLRSQFPLCDPHQWATDFMDALSPEAIEWLDVHKVTASFGGVPDELTDTREQVEWFMSRMVSLYEVVDSAEVER